MTALIGGKSPVSYEGEMSRMAMIIDMDRCVGCGACVISCQEEWALPDGVARNWVHPMHPVSSPYGLSYTHHVGLCNHCGNATCLKACPTGATFRDHKGRIRVDADTCIGCGYCVDACPYGARMVRKDTRRVEKCDFCAPRVDRGLAPACVHTCPADARVFGDLDDRESPVSRYFLTHPVRRNETDKVSIKPNVLYAGKVLDRVFGENPPDPRKTRPPIQGRILEKALRPGFGALFLLAFAGQAIAFMRQLAKGEDASAASPAEQTADTKPDRMLKRRDTAIIWLHWFNAVVWLLQILTGFGLLGSSRYRVMPGWFDEAALAVFGSRQSMFQFHVTLGKIWVVVLIVYGIFGFKRYALPFLRNLVLDRTDIPWLAVKFRRMLLRSSAELPAQGRYNAGQKLFGIAVVSGTFLVILSGLIMVLLPGSGELVRWAIPAHFAGAAMAVVALPVHIYMAAFVPSERPAFLSMFNGRIPESYAREHNRKWWEEKTGRRQDPSPHASTGSTSQNPDAD